MSGAPALIPWEMNKELVVSTTHITEEDARLLERILGRGPVMGHHTDFGWVIWAQCLQHMDEEEKVAWRSDVALTGMSEAFMDLVFRANDMGCKWLHLDSDGPVYEGLPMFEW